jgi:tetratricopeptide (TPR) repeat protein
MPDRAQQGRELYLKGLSCWKEKHYDRALHLFQKAHEIYPENPFVASYLGATLVKVGIVERGLDLCRQAVKKRPFQEDILYNLGQAYLWVGNRAEARRTFLLGAKGCNDSNRFLDALRKMGVRRKPIIPFLSRDHFLNRWLGKLTYRPGMFRLEDIEN